MRLTKKTHACVAFEKDGQTLVIDPGGFSTDETEAVGAEAILITHEHRDHFHEGRLRAALEANPAAQVWTVQPVAKQIAAAFPGRVHTVGAGDAFTAAGFDVRVHGEHHAVIHPDIPVVPNVGFLLDGAVFHPGDALTVPEQPVETLLLPLSAPWSKASEVIDYVREVKPRRVHDIHDALLVDFAAALYGGLVDRLAPAGRERLEPGTTIDLPR